MKKKWIVISSSCVLAIVIITAFLFFRPAKKLMRKMTAKVTGKPEAFCPIDGMPTTIEKAENKPLAIMVENFAPIRPQSGLSKACIIFEAQAEGGITRFLAIFNHNDSKMVGPVRSARPYYVALATGFDAVYAHVGGSKVGFEKIKEYGVDDFDQFGHANAFWRQSGIGAPHNVFANTKKLRTEAENSGLKETDYTGFKFSKKNIKGNQAKNISVDFSSKSYLVQYRYDGKSKKYERLNGGIAHKDAGNNKQLAPSNVVVVRANTTMYDAKTLNIAIIGKGSGLFFRSGKEINITWEKTAAASQIIFRDSQGKEIRFYPGQIWVEVVEPKTAVDFK